MLTNQTTTMYDLIQSSVEYDQNKVDFTSPAQDIKFFTADETAMISVPDSDLGAFSAFLEETDAPFTGITRHALYQLCQKLPYDNPRRDKSSMLPADFMEHMMKSMPEQFASVMSEHAMGNDKPLFVRTYGDTIRAVLSERYGVVENTDMLNVLNDVIESSDMANVQIMSGSFLTPDALGIKAKFFDRPTDSDGGYSVGVYIGNNEIGGGKVRIAPIVQRNSCTNSIIADHTNENAVAMRHIGSQLANKVINTSIIARCLNLADTLVDKMIEGYSHEVNELDKVLGGMAKKYDLGNTATANLGIGTSYGGGKPNSKTGVVNALTFVAHNSGFTAERQIELELKAGQLLEMPANKFDAQMKTFATIGSR